MPVALSPLQEKLAAHAREVGDKIAATQAELADLADDRRFAIEQLHASGLTYRDIARHVGLSAPRIGQILADPKREASK